MEYTTDIKASPYAEHDRYRLSVEPTGYVGSHNLYDNEQVTVKIVDMDPHINKTVCQFTVDVNQLDNITSNISQIVTSLRQHNVEKLRLSWVLSEIRSYILTRSINHLKLELVKVCDYDSAQIAFQLGTIGVDSIVHEQYSFIATLQRNIPLRMYIGECMGYNYSSHKNFFKDNIVVKVVIDDEVSELFRDEIQTEGPE